MAVEASKMSANDDGQLLNVQPTTGDFAALNAIKRMREINHRKQIK